jgi:hypothetical protein
VNHVGKFIDMNPRFFPTPSAFRKWLAANHAKSKELSVGFYKKGSGKPEHYLA